MLAALLAAVVFLWQREETAPIEPEEVNNRVAVEDFENRTGDISLDSLGSMAADWITQGLSELGMIEVVPAATAPAEAGTLVTGNYYVQGDTIVFQSNVMDVEEGTILYSLKPVSGSRDSPMDVMEDLRQRVMGALAFRFVPPRFIDTRLYTPPFNMEAYQGVHSRNGVLRCRLRTSYAPLGEGVRSGSGFHFAPGVACLCFR